MSSTLGTLQKTQEKIEQGGGAHLGTLFWWDLEGNHIAHNDLEALATIKNLDRKFLPAAIRPVQAFKRAISHADTLLDKELRLAKIKDDKVEVVFGVVEERADAIKKDLKFKVLARVEFNKTTNHLGNDVDHPAVAKVKEMYHYHLDHDTDDIRRMMANFLSTAGVGLRQSGGVYFVPAKYQITLDALCDVVGALGQNQTYQLRVIDTPESRRTLVDVTQKGLDTEIRQLQDEIDKFAFEKAKKTTLESKLEGFEDLRARVNMFSSVLEFKAEVLNAKIDKIKKIVQGHLDPSKYKDEPEDKPEEPKPKKAEAFSKEAGF